MDKPTFYIEVVMGGYVSQPDEWRYPRISWHCVGGFCSGGMNSTVAWRKAQLGRYACYRVDPVGIDVPLKQPLVEIDQGVAERVLRAFETGYVDQADVDTMRRAIAVAMRGGGNG